MGSDFSPRDHGWELARCEDAVLPSGMTRITEVAKACLVGHPGRDSCGQRGHPAHLIAAGPGVPSTCSRWHPVRALQRPIVALWPMRRAVSGISKASLFPLFLLTPTLFLSGSSGLTGPVSDGIVDISGQYGRFLPLALDRPEFAGMQSQEPWCLAWALYGPGGPVSRGNTQVRKNAWPRIGF